MKSRRGSRGLALAFLLVALAERPRSQEPTPPVGEEGGGTEQEGTEEGTTEKKSTEKQNTEQEKPDAPPARDVQEPPAPAPETPLQQAAESPPTEDAMTTAAPTESARPHPAVTWPLPFEAISVHLRGIAELYPEVAALEVIGTSAGGREILALRLGARAQATSETPVLLLVDYQGPGSAGPEALLSLAWKLAAGFEQDERVRGSLTRAALVIAPALDPDARANAKSPDSVRFERNFPSGWQPESIRALSGRISLSEPESLAFVRYLTSLRGCAVLLGFARPGPRGSPYPEAELPPADHEVFSKLRAALDLEGASSLVPWFEIGSPGGGLFDFAYQACGIYPLAFSLPAEDELLATGLGTFASAVETRVLRCLMLLPRIEIAQEGLERVASDTWQLDVRIQNTGIVPTSSALAHREPLADVALRLEGAKLVATAKKPAADADFTEASFRVRAPLSGGTLVGGEGRWLRLFLEAGSGAEVRVTASSLWGGSASVQVTLP